VSVLEKEVKPDIYFCGIVEHKNLLVGFFKGKMSVLIWSCDSVGSYEVSYNVGMCAGNGHMSLTYDVTSFTLL
jgi:hypothetical protein